MSGAVREAGGVAGNQCSRKGKEALQLAGSET